ncbi:hypothetical protein [Staphylococcus phage vB_SauH_DELF3]|nr:hypothetical protein [Staphylococcus phage vB_SauH_DELF3]
MTIYKISNHVHYSNFEMPLKKITLSVDFPNFELDYGSGLYNSGLDEYVVGLTVSFNNPGKRKGMSITSSDQSPIDYLIVLKDAITHSVWFDIYTWLQP